MSEPLTQEAMMKIDADLRAAIKDVPVQVAGSMLAHVAIRALILAGAKEGDCLRFLRGVYKAEREVVMKSGARA